MLVAMSDAILDALLHAILDALMHGILDGMLNASINVILEVCTLKPPKDTCVHYLLERRTSY